MQGLIAMISTQFCLFNSSYPVIQWRVHTATGEDRRGQDELEIELRNHYDNHYGG